MERPQEAGSTGQVLSEMHRTKVIYYLPLLLFAMTGTPKAVLPSRVMSRVVTAAAVNGC